MIPESVLHQLRRQQIRFQQDRRRDRRANHQSIQVKYTHVHTGACTHSEGHTAQSIQEPAVTLETGNLWTELRSQVLEQHLLAATLTRLYQGRWLRPPWIFCLLKVTFYFPTSLQLTLYFYGHCANAATTPSQSYDTTPITMANITVTGRVSPATQSLVRTKSLSQTGSMSSGSICEVSRDKWIEIEFIFPPVSNLLTSLFRVACLGSWWKSWVWFSVTPPPLGWPLHLSRTHVLLQEKVRQRLLDVDVRA